MLKANSLFISYSYNQRKIKMFSHTKTTYKQYMAIKLMLLSCLALIPEYIMRSTLAINGWFYQKFTTYYGDLWYCWNNYLHVGFPYPREYPSLIQQIFQLIALIPDTEQNYTYYIIFPVILLSICALICTYLLYKLQANTTRIIWLWILAPSYLFYGLLNLDFLPILTILFSYYYFERNRHITAIIWLALGTAIKVFPLFLLPIYIFSCNNHKKRFILLIIFIIIWLILNIPFMIGDWNAWLFPYVWQIQNNFSKNATDGSWTWVIFYGLSHFGYGSWSGKVSLIIFAISYFYLIRKYWYFPFARKLMLVIILFLLTDRVYSPQYNLYLLPFLVLVDYKINWKYFYLLEIPNFIQVFFVFAIKALPLLQQSVIFIKYAALIMLLLQLLREPIGTI